MIAKVDAESCIGCTLCAQTCAQVFHMEREKAVVYVSPVPKGAESSCKQAADECPVTAISIQE